MATIETFPYHRQDDEAMCGPACAQMVLDYLKQELPSQIDIRLAADSLKEATATIWQNYEYDGWATRPDELGYALLPLGQAISITFTAQYKGNPSKYKTLLSTDSINHSDSPAYPIVPVHGTFYYKQQFGDYIEASGYSDLAEKNLDAKSFYDAHWIVLFKYESEGFVGNDPYFPLSNGDGKHTQTKPNGEKDNCKTVLIHINGSTDSIRDINFPEINRAAILWKGSTNNLRKSGRPPVEPPLIEPPYLSPPPLKFRPSPRRNNVFNQTALRSQMRALGLFSNRPCAPYLTGTDFGPPRFVRRLDVPYHDYYLVPMLKPDGNSTALVRVDASTGDYLDSLYYSENPFLFDESPARETLVNATIPERLANMRKSKWKKPYSTQIDEPKTELVWLPCRQSVSAFFPFYVIQATDERFLVRVDGKVFPKLTY